MLAKLIYKCISLFNDQNITIGKTKLQKIFFLSFPKEIRRLYFRPYYYGPYSDEVQSVLGSLLLADFLKYDSDTYNINIKNRIEITLNEEEKNIFDNLEKIFHILNTKNALKNVKDISNISKITYLKEEKALENNLNLGAVKSRAKDYGWNDFKSVEKKEFNKYLQIVEEIGELAQVGEQS
jgi:hypothetical protein